MGMRDGNLERFVQQSQFGPGLPAAPRAYVTPPAVPPVPPVPPVQYVGTLGWDTGKLNDPTHQSPKYQFMRAMQTAGLDPISATKDPAAVVAAINKMHPDAGAKVGQNGRINGWGLGDIDYSIDSGKGGWFFQPEATAGQGAAMPAASASATPYRDLYSGMTAPDPNAIFQQMMQQ